jgi:hypothetical protein
MPIVVALKGLISVIYHGLIQIADNKHIRRYEIFKLSCGLKKGGNFFYYHKGR